MSDEVKILHAYAQKLEAMGCWGMAEVVRKWIQEALNG